MSKPEKLTPARPRADAKQTFKEEGGRVYSKEQPKAFTKEFVKEMFDPPRPLGVEANYDGRGNKRDALTKDGGTGVATIIVSMAKIPKYVKNNPVKGSLAIAATVGIAAGLVAATVASGGLVLAAGAVAAGLTVAVGAAAIGSVARQDEKAAAIKKIAAQAATGANGIDKSKTRSTSVSTPTQSPTPTQEKPVSGPAPTQEKSVSTPIQSPTQTQDKPVTPQAKSEGAAPTPTKRAFRNDLGSHKSSSTPTQEKPVTAAAKNNANGMREKLEKTTVNSAKSSGPPSTPTVKNRGHQTQQGRAF